MCVSLLVAGRILGLRLLYLHIALDIPLVIPIEISIEIPIEISIEIPIEIAIEIRLVKNAF